MDGITGFGWTVSANADPAAVSHNAATKHKNTRLKNIQRTHNSKKRLRIIL